MSEVSEPIVVSSSDEESPPKKKLKSILKRNLVGITITPILKENESKSVCVISDEDEDDDSKSVVKESLDVDKTEERFDSIICNKETVKKGNDDIRNKDCEIVSVHNTQQIIDITEPEDTEVPSKNQNKIESSYDNETNEKNNEKLENQDCNIVSVKTVEQIIDITENNDENDVVSCIVIDEAIKNNENSVSSETHLENDLNSEFCKNKSEKNNDLLLDQIETSNVEISEKSTELISTNFIEDFLEVCKTMLDNTEYNLSKQFKVLKQYYKKCEPKLIECEDFKRLIENNMKKAKLSPHQAVISFDEVFKHVKDLVKVNTIEVTKKKKIVLKKLEKTIKLLVHKIKELENEEVDFDDEEDSSYLKIERYISRLNKVYFKYCEYLKSNPHAGRITYSKLNFVDSKYNEINRAISKKYKDNKIFPSYYEMENFIKNVLQTNNLELTDNELKAESQHCFKKLGELLQTRRKRDLYDSHCLYIQDSGDDPANKDKNLQTVLETNFATAQKKIEQLCQEYVTKEQRGEGGDMSSNNETESSDNENEDTS